MNLTPAQREEFITLLGAVLREEGVLFTDGEVDCQFTDLSLWALEALEEVDENLGKLPARVSEG